MFRWLTSAIRRSARVARTMVARVSLAARYDAAQTNADNRRHWANADLLGPNAANTPEVRQTLRARARYECANNTYAAGILDTLANDLVGTGPRLQVVVGARDNDPDREISAEIEREFSAWAKGVRLSELLRVARKTMVRDGEVFALLSMNPKLPNPVKLDLQLIEADQVRAPWSQFAPSGSDGIEYDEYGNPTRYYVLDEHPGDLPLLPTADGRYIRSRYVLHYFEQTRPNQCRGIPLITPALPLFAQLRRYTLAVLAAAETAADFAAFLHTDAPAGADPDSAAELPTIEIESRMFTPLPEGWNATQMRAEQPTTTYAEFKREILKEIARAVGMPYNIAAGDSSDYNYASGRLDIQTYRKLLSVARSQIERSILDPLFRAWVNEAVQIRDYLPDLARFRDLIGRHRWMWDGHEHVDPVKEANAQQTRLQSLTTTLADEYALQGKDWEQQLEQIALEQGLIKRLGITVGAVSPAATVVDDETDAERSSRRA